MASAIPEIELRKPVGRDAPRVWSLIQACPPLDTNSRYCNLLQCTDFRDTCVVADDGDEPVGWVSAYRPPREQDTLFVWQVAVHPRARGTGLSKAMLLNLLERDVCDGVSVLKTTVTPDNDASRAMFHSLAATLDAPIDELHYFDSDRHFLGRHDSENLITIGEF